MSSLAEKLMSIIPILVASPILLVVLIIFGIFTLDKFIISLISPILIGTSILLTIGFFAYRKSIKQSITGKQIVFSGIVAGLILWISGLISFLTTPVGGAVCGFPVLGPLLCGTGAFISVVIDLPGMILAGLFVSGILGFGLIVATEK